MFAVGQCAKWTHVDVFASHAALSRFLHADGLFSRIFMRACWLAVLWERKWGRCLSLCDSASALHLNPFSFIAAMAAGIVFLACLPPRLSWEGWFSGKIWKDVFFGASINFWCEGKLTDYSAAFNLTYFFWNDQKRLARSNVSANKNMGGKNKQFGLKSKV